MSRSADGQVSYGASTTRDDSPNGSEKQTKSSPLVLNRLPALHLVKDTPKGRGVFASHPISSGTIIDTCPVLILSPQENATHIEKTSLYHYTYNWPLPPNPTGPRKTQAVVFGLGSMFNHSKRHQNVGWTRDLENEVVVYRALRDIAVGEELCISYGDHLTFQDAEAREEADDEAGRAEELLERIQLVDD